MRRLLVTLLVVCTPGVVSCSMDAGDDELREVSLAGSQPPAPESLSSLAQSLRSGAGGAVFLGLVPESTEVAPPSRVNLGGGMWVDYPLESADIVIEDSLGEAVGTQFEVTARNDDPPIITDAAGEPYGNVIVTGLLPVSTNRRLVEGRSVLFAGIDSPGGGTWTLVWRAAVVGNGMVSGEGTQTGTDVTLDSLRRE